MTDIPIESLTESTSVIGDPHIYGFEGDFFNFNGEDNKHYCLLSVVNMQVNALFVGGSRIGGTTMQKIGIKMGRTGEGIHEVEVGLSPDFYGTVNGDPLELDKKLTFTNSRDKFSVASSPNSISVSDGCYLIKLTSSSEGEEFPYINVIFKLINEQGILSHGILPHGIIGQTADIDNIARFSEGWQGEGAIDGVYQDYEVSGLFAHDFKFNRFGTQPVIPPIIGVFPSKRSSRTAIV